MSGSVFSAAGSSIPLALRTSSPPSGSCLLHIVPSAGLFLFGGREQERSSEKGLALLFQLVGRNKPNENALERKVLRIHVAICLNM